MPRRRRTDPAKATLVRAMGDIGFPVALISEVAELPRQTVNDIVQGRGVWQEMPRNELYATLKARILTDLENCAGELAMQTISKIEEKMETASFMELITMSAAMAEIAFKGGQRDER